MSPVTALVGAGLGSTDNPRDLVPGHPAAIHAVADTLGGHSATFEDVGEGLGKIDVPSWQGPASNAFWESYAEEKPRWLRASDSMTAAERALRDYADTLAWAQGQARDAIDMWRRGQALTLRHQQAQPPHAQDGTWATLTDPGATLRQDAQALLDHARQQLADAGDRAAARIRAAGGHDDDAPAWLAETASAVADADSDSTLGELKLSPGSFSDVSDTSKWKVSLGKISGDASVWGWDGEGATTAGPLDLEGSAGLDILGLSGEGKAEISRQGLAAEAKGTAYLLHGEADGSARWGVAEVGATGEGYVGAEAKGTANLGTDGVKLEGEAFAGAKAEGKLNADVGGVGAGLKGEAWAGAGAAASATFGRDDDGTYTIGAEAGAGLGIGGKVGFEVTVDPSAVADTVSSAASAISDLW